MENYYLLFSKLETRKFLPGDIIRTRCVFSGLMNYMKEERARQILDILEECDSEEEYREKMGKSFWNYAKY